MSYSILRTKKHKSIASLKSRETHTFRTRPTPNADEKRKHKNKLLYGREDYAQSLQEGLEKYAQSGKKIRSDAVMAIEYLLTASPEFFDGLDMPKQQRRLQEWCDLQVKFLVDKHGAENVKCIYLHLDEKTPHLEAYVIPIDPKGSLNCKHFLGGAKKLKELQSDYAKTNEGFGLKRGIQGSRAKHTTMTKFYGALAKDSGLTKDEVVQAIDVLTPGVKDHLNWDEFEEKQRQHIFKALRPIFKRLLDQSKLGELAEQTRVGWQRERKALEKKFYEQKKELEKLHRLENEASANHRHFDSLREDHEALKRAFNEVQTENTDLKKKLGVFKFEPKPQPFSGRA